MLDQNWKTWLLMIVAVVGLSFEVLKYLSSEESKSWTTENLGLADNKPYSVHDLAQTQAVLPARKKAPAVDAKILQHELQKFVAASQPTKTEFDKNVLDTKAAKKKSDDEWEEVIDPKTGKKIRRKKKKDAKKIDKKEDVAKSKLTPPPLPVAKDDIGAALDTAVATGGLPAAGAALSKNTSPFKSLEEWMRLLLAHPDLAETRIFLKDFQTHLVTADIFYKISQLMVADSRLEMKQLGVLCLGTTPSVLSFQLLAGVQKQERAGSPERSQVEALLGQYGSLNRLPLIEKVLMGGDTHSQTVAAQILDSAAKQFLTTPNPDPNGGPTAQSVPPANASRFQPFLSVLQGLSQSHDSALAAQARQTVNDLQTLLGTTSLASTQTP